jgi:hypothetical protein
MTSVEGGGSSVGVAAGVHAPSTKLATIKIERIVISFFIVLFTPFSILTKRETGKSVWGN